MKPEKIVVSKTVELVDVWGRSTWTKVGIEGLVGESEDVQDAIDKAMVEIENAHERFGVVNNPQTQLPPPKPSSKLTPDKAIIESYNKARERKDDKMAKILEATYNF